MKVSHTVYELARWRCRLGGGSRLKLPLLVVVVPENEAQQQAWHHDVTEAQHAEAFRPASVLRVEAETARDF